MTLAGINVLSAHNIIKFWLGETDPVRLHSCCARLYINSIQIGRKERNFIWMEYVWDGGSLQGVGSLVLQHPLLCSTLTGSSSHLVESCTAPGKASWFGLFSSKAEIPSCYWSFFNHFWPSLTPFETLWKEACSWEKFHRNLIILLAMTFLTITIGSFWSDGEW